MHVDGDEWSEKLTSSQKNGLARSAEANRGKRRFKEGRHPATSGQRYYEEDEVEFLAAVQAYQKETGHKFPMFTELLYVLKSLGYEKVKRNDSVES